MAGVQPRSRTAAAAAAKAQLEAAPSQNEEDNRSTNTAQQQHWILNSEKLGSGFGFRNTPQNLLRLLRHATWQKLPSYYIDLHAKCARYPHLQVLNSFDCDINVSRPPILARLRRFRLLRHEGTARHGKQGDTNLARGVPCESLTAWQACLVLRESCRGGPNRRLMLQPSNFESDRCPANTLRPNAAQPCSSERWRHRRSK